MQGTADETVGDGFQEDLLIKARDKTLEVIHRAARLVKPGMTESQAKELLQSIQMGLGGAKSWHPPQIRFGQNTLCPFGKTGAENVALQEKDIFFFDVGPIFDGHEGDVGRTFFLGQDPEMIQCCHDVEETWQEVRNHWKSNGVSGAELYEFARARAQLKGWALSLEKANGHRIADFPHAARSRGSIEGRLDHPAPNRWILEIQIRHPVKNFGAFYEDILN
jgi:Xaa-Pro aminopeptidase